MAEGIPMFIIMELYLRRNGERAYPVEKTRENKKINGTFNLSKVKKDVLNKSMKFALDVGINMFKVCVNINKLLFLIMHQ